MTSTTYMSKVDFITNNKNRGGLGKKKHQHNGAEEKIVYEKDIIYKVNDNLQANLSNMKIPEQGDKVNLLSMINESKKLIDQYHKFFRNLQIGGKKTKQTIVKEQVTSENFFSKKASNRHKNKQNEIRRLQNLFDNQSNNSKNKINHDTGKSALTGIGDAEEQNIETLYYIKKINLENYKKIFNIGQDMGAINENLQYLQSLPEKNIFQETINTNDTKFTFFNNDTGMFYNKNLAYGKDESAFMANLMIKLEKKRNAKQNKMNCMDFYKKTSLIRKGTLNDSSTPNFINLSNIPSPGRRNSIRQENKNVSNLKNLRSIISANETNNYSNLTLLNNKINNTSNTEPVNSILVGSIGSLGIIGKNLANKTSDQSILLPTLNKINKQISLKENASSHSRKKISIPLNKKNLEIQIKNNFTTNEQNYMDKKFPGWNSKKYSSPSVISSFHINSSHNNNNNTQINSQSDINTLNQSNFISYLSRPKSLFDNNLSFYQSKF